MQTNQANLAPEIDAYEGTAAREARENLTSMNGGSRGIRSGGGCCLERREIGEGGLAEERSKTAHYYEHVWRSTDF